MYFMIVRNAVNLTFMRVSKRLTRENNLSNAVGEMLEN
jgi:hypothetical protein